MQRIAWGIKIKGERKRVFWCVWVCEREKERELKQ